MARGQKRKSRFDFSKLPGLPLELIASFMDIRDIIDLSLCSKKCALAFHLIDTIPIKMYILFECDQLRVRLYENNENLENSFMWLFKKKMDMRVKKTIRRVNGIDICTGPTFQFIARDTKKIIATQGLMSAYPRKKEPALRAVISHILHVFRRCHVEFLHVGFKSAESRIKVRDTIPTVSIVKRVNLEDLESEDFKWILKNITITHHIKSEYQCISGSKLMDKLHCTDYISFDSTPWMRRETILNLNCTEVSMKKTRFDADDFMEFLRKWKNSTGDDMKNIKYLNIEHPPGIEPLDLEELEAKPWDPTKRAKVLLLDEYKWINPYNGIDIERSDGLLGTIHQDYGNLFCFVVWHDRFPVQPPFEFNNYNFFIFAQ